MVLASDDKIRVSAVWANFILQSPSHVNITIEPPFNTDFGIKELIRALDRVKLRKHFKRQNYKHLFSKIGIDILHWFSGQISFNLYFFLLCLTCFINNILYKIKLKK